MKEFFNMGGYAFFVWTSYGIAFLILLINIVIPLQEHKNILKRMAKKAKRAEEEA